MAEEEEKKKEMDYVEKNKEAWADVVKIVGVVEEEKAQEEGVELMSSTNGEKTMHTFSRLLEFTNTEDDLGQLFAHSSSKGEKAMVITFCIQVGVDSMLQWSEHNS